MIQSKSDYIEYLRKDKIALGINKRKPRVFGDEVWKFEILLRKYEYWLSVNKSGIMGFFKRIICEFFHLVYHNRCIKLGYQIPPNVFGPGLSIAHIGGNIVVNKKAYIGAGCRIHDQVIIGTQAGFSDKCPRIGNNVFIGPGAKIFGDISIGDNIAIGANSVVIRSFPNDVTIAGTPAKIVSNKSSHDYLNAIEVKN